MKSFSRKQIVTSATIVVAAIVAISALFIWSSYHSPQVDFNEDVRPILNANCTVCHGGVKREAGFSLLFRSDALSSAESGKPAIIPGEAAASELIHRVASDDPDRRMPRNGEPLSDQEINTLRAWIDQGAEWDDHWAYVAPRPVELPEVSDVTWPRNELDYFVLNRLEQEGLSPSRRADCARLIRRVSLDLVGLPPELEDVEEFCADPTPETYERIVDRLLDSPRFGEKWARMWLDLARYADSKGYEADLHRSIWKYRDWVIQAFNEDKPFDQFTIEQLAGDLLPDPTEEQLIATAFHRNTMSNSEGGTDDEEFRIAAIIDRVNTTFEAWQGTTMSCAQCHSHPFDPFRQSEYYEFMAFLNTTADADRNDDRPNYYSFSPENEKEGRRLARRLTNLREELLDLAETEEIISERRAWEERLRVVLEDTPRPAKFDDQLIPGKIIDIVQVAEEARTREQELLLNEHFLSISKLLKPRRDELEQVAEQLESLNPVRTPIMREIPSERTRRTYILDRGNWLVRGEEVQPDVPESLNPLPEDTERGRLAMAKWLVSPDNPLTARVIVNRFWSKIFGRGIVDTPGDFGTQGSRPSHPELLDWLALAFVNDHHWSVKQLLKQMVLSATYQQSSQIRPDLHEKDPVNRLLARAARIRLSAEQIRDQALAVSGLLSSKMFGPSVMPPQPPGIWANPYDDREWETSEGEDRYRRAVYTYWRRTTPYPSMVTFDAPSREFCVSQRIKTNTPLQALVLMNDPVYVEAAMSLARRMADYSTRPAEQLHYGYRLALIRNPDAVTIDVLSNLYREALEHYGNESGSMVLLEAFLDQENVPSDTPDLAALTVVANAIMNLDEFANRE